MTKTSEVWKEGCRITYKCLPLHEEASPLGEENGGGGWIWSLLQNLQVNQRFKDHIKRQYICLQWPPE